LDISRNKVYTYAKYLYYISVTLINLAYVEVETLFNVTPQKKLNKYK